MDKLYKALAAAASALIFSSAALAGQSADQVGDMPLESSAPVIVTSWRVIGPALSWHSSTDSAPIVRHTRPAIHVITPGPTPQDLSTGELVPGRPSLRAWNQTHVALGLARVQRDVLAGSTVRDVGQILEDSYGKPGLMAGRGWSWDLHDGEKFRLEAGISAGLWWRTSGQDVKVPSNVHFEDYYVTTKLHRALLPILLPLATITHKPSGADLTISFVPKSSINEYHISSTDVLMLQVSFPLGK